MFDNVCNVANGKERVGEGRKKAPKKNRLSERACFENQSNERVRLKK